MKRLCITAYRRTKNGRYQQYVDDNGVIHNHINGYMICVKPIDRLLDVRITKID